MRYNFSEIQNQNDLLEQKLLDLKKEYQDIKMSHEQLERLSKKIKEANMDNRNGCVKRKMIKSALTAAVLIGAFVILPNTSSTVANAMKQMPIIGQLIDVVTFRNYKYETDRNKADIKVPEIVLDDQITDNAVKDNLKHTTDEINAEIKKITNDLVAEFKENLRYEEGYQDVMVKSEVLTTTPDYFTLKLLCYQGAGSGYQWNYYYTVDLNTGKRLKLKDIFDDGTDYIARISENIKKQMKEQMAADENVCYWIDQEIEEWNFKTITEETSFYLNEKDNVVVAFDEGDVAPMYMGAVEFEIPSEVLADIRK